VLTSRPGAGKVDFAALQGGVRLHKRILYFRCVLTGHRMSTFAEYSVLAALASHDFVQSEYQCVKPVRLAVIDPPTTGEACRPDAPSRGLMGAAPQIRGRDLGGARKADRGRVHGPECVELDATSSPTR